MNKWVILIFTLSLTSETFSRETHKNSRTRRSGLITPSIASGVAILKELPELWNVLLRNPSADLTSAIFRSKENQLLGRISQLNKNVQGVNNEIVRQHGMVVSTVMTALPQTIKTELALDELAKIIDKIDTAHQEFSDYISGAKFGNLSSASPKMAQDTMDQISSLQHVKTTFEKVTLTNFVSWATGHGGDSIKTLLGRLHKITLPENHIRTGLFELLNRQSKVFKVVNQTPR